MRHVLSNIYVPSLYRESVEENNDILSFDVETACHLYLLLCIDPICLFVDLWTGARKGFLTACAGWSFRD